MRAFVKLVLFKASGELEKVCGTEFNEAGVLRGKLPA